ncbi:NAD(P)-binding protein [Suillus ampliporus]|nr:NAD(P)-binding protein [Suillus ampliporus]
MAESKVTGSSSGFGRSMAELLLKDGNRVIATLRRKEALSDLAKQYPSSQLLIVQMDVVNSSEVAAAFAKAREVFGVVAFIGEMETLSDEEARRIFEAIRMFEKLLQVSSALGLIGRPAITIVVAHTDFPALEGFSEGVAQELDPAWNIKVTIIEPGPFRTRMFTDNMHPSPQHPAYDNPELAGSKFPPVDGDTEKAVVVIEKLTRLDEPPLRLPLHRGTIKAGREKAKSLIDTMDRYESWSENIYFT